MDDRDRLLELARAGLASLEANRRRIDDLNVYPVPDGDTGTNMTLTARAVVDQLAATKARDRADLAEEATRAALLGARGNSGVILSQIVRGAADVLADEDDVARALRGASDAAYRAVREPVEGTILSAIRALADEAGRGADWPALVRAGDAAVARTEQQLEVLEKAHVVDAGAAGLMEIVRGIAAAITGEELPPAVEREELALEAVHQELSRYRYCTTFVVEGNDLDAGAIEAELDKLGDSLLVVGDERALKVHVHTDDPGRALSHGTRVGTVEHVEIANMHAQTQAREERLSAAGDGTRTAVVAVVSGDGNRALFDSLGATELVTGGQTMNPSAADIVAAIERAGAPHVIVLPNNSNVVLAAEQAARLSSKDVRVVATDSIPAGLAAMVAFDTDSGADENAKEMTDVVASLATGEVTVASRDAQLNGVSVREGEFLGLVAAEAVASGADFEDVATTVAERLLVDGRSVLTLLTGDDPPELEDVIRRVRECHPEVELDVHHGGQPHYPLLLSAE